MDVIKKVEKLIKELGFEYSFLETCYCFVNGNKVVIGCDKGKLLLEAQEALDLLEKLKKRGFHVSKYDAKLNKFRVQLKHIGDPEKYDRRLALFKKMDQVSEKHAEAFWKELDL